MKRKRMKLVILFSPGGLGDVGRHAIRAALDYPSISKITVLTQYPVLIEEENWKCGCPKELHAFSANEKERLEIITVTDWEDYDELATHLEDAEAIISALGHRQPPLMYPEMKNIASGLEGNRFVVRTLDRLSSASKPRIIVVSSIGIGKEDWPPMEWHWAGKAMACIFRTCGKQQFKDLNLIEEMYTDSNVGDYVFVHPVGLDENLVPQGEWLVQKEKFKDRNVGTALAKLDCARFCVSEIVKPTHHNKTVVVGSPLKKNSGGASTEYDL